MAGVINYISQQSHLFLHHHHLLSFQLGSLLLIVFLLSRGKVEFQILWVSFWQFISDSVQTGKWSWL